MLLIALLALASPDAKTSAMDDWTAATIVSIGSQSSENAGSQYLIVQTGDLDGDGAADQSYLKLACDGGKLTGAWIQAKSGREASTGMATGKRMHKPLTLVKVWGAVPASSSQLKATYDLKMAKGARMSASDDWSPVELRNSDGLCAATSAASKAIIKSKSNITNN